MRRKCDPAEGFDILLVEDNPADAQLALEAFYTSGFPHRCHVVRDGVEALKFLRRRDPYGAAPRPHLVFLDLNLPRKDGREVLAELKKDADLSVVPVIVLTSSTAEEDVRKSYQMHANCHLGKCLELDCFFERVNGALDLWLRLAELPPR